MGLRLLGQLSFFLVISISHADPKSRLFLHWGDIQGNHTLLEKGGYQGPWEHFSDIGIGNDATLNEDTLNQAREWYERAGKTDVAGSGFYMSPELNSRQFGNDLLIAELQWDSSPPNVEVRSADYIKSISDEALKIGTFGHLPPLVKYNAVDWHVVSRAPQPSDGFRIVFRAPRPNDVKQTWAQWNEKGGEVEMLNRLNNISVDLSKTYDLSTPDDKMWKRPTRSSQIFLERILFDEAPALIREKLIPYAMEQYKRNGSFSLKSIFSLFEANLPNDQRTHDLHIAAAHALLELPRAYLNEDALELLSTWAKVIPLELRKEIVETALKNFPEEILSNKILELTRLVSGVWHNLDATTKRRLLPKIRDGFSVYLGDQLDLNIRPDLEKILGPDVAQSLLRQQFHLALLEKVPALTRNDPKGNVSHSNVTTPKKQFRSSDAWKWLDKSTKALSEMPKSAFLDALIGKIFEKLKPLKLEERKSADRVENLLRLYPKIQDPQQKQRLLEWLEKTAYEKWASSKKVMAASYIVDDDPLFAKFVRKLAIEAKVASAELINSLTASEVKMLFLLVGHERENVLARNWRVTHGIVIDKKQADWYLKRIYRRSNELNRQHGAQALFTDSYLNRAIEYASLYSKAADFEDYILGLLRDFPRNVADIRQSLERTQKYFDVEGEKGINWAFLHKECEKRLVPEQRFLLIAQAVHEGINYGAVTKRPTLQEVAEKIRPVVLNIESDLAYSELSRTFALVDPAFVSEDLRRMNASRPFERFNEQFSHQGRELTQPTWKNFNLAWAKILQIPLLRQALAASGYKEKFEPLGMQLSDIHKVLMATGVDGGAQNNWDRKKYRIKIPAADWANWGLRMDESNIRRYFDVAKTTDGYELNFRSLKDLQKVNPRLASSSANWAREYYYLLEFLGNEMGRVKDPIQRAARILYLVPRLHPFENGNGRLARLWAAAELKVAGLPMPMGFPTHDFMMDQRRLEGEVRRSVKLGQFWEEMLKKAKADGVSTDEFFQKRFRGSELEGLMHISPRDPKEFADYLAWLESQNEPPKWAKDFGEEIARELAALQYNGSSLADRDELARANMIESSWQNFKSSRDLLLFAPLPCQRLSSRLKKGSSLQIIRAKPQ